MPETIELPKMYDEIDAQRRLVGEGEHTVQVQSIAEQPDGRVVATLTVIDDGPYAQAILYDSFSLNVREGLRSLKEFVQAIGVATPERRLSPAACAGKKLRVTIEHQTAKDGKVYANVVRRMTPQA